MNVYKNANLREIHVINLQEYEGSVDNIQGYIIETKHLVTCTMLVDTTVHPSFWGYNG